MGTQLMLPHVPSASPPAETRRRLELEREMLELKAELERNDREGHLTIPEHARVAARFFAIQDEFYSLQEEAR